jgi:hypothetical protein
MKYPCLVKEKYCKAEVHVVLNQEGVNNDGDRLEPVMVDTTCNFQNSAKTVLTAEKKLVQLSGVALFPGDIAPELPAISGGTITVHGVKRKIFQGRKARNPDGSVNYCELDVM